MIYRIAESPPGGKGLVGIYPSWQDEEHAADARVLEATRQQYASILFTRNYFSQFFERIAPALRAYGHMVDIVSGWEVEKICSFFLSFNPQVEIFPISAMHFNHFELLDEVRTAQAQAKGKTFDLFFTAIERHDQLKNMELLARLLGAVKQPLKVVGYGKGSEKIWQEINKNPNLSITFRQKAKVDDPLERRAFLEDMARSRGLLITSRCEGYSRLIGEALYLQVPVLLHAGIQCENWIHLNHQNCRTYIEATFEASLKEFMSQNWRFTPPVYEDGSVLLQNCFNAYLSRRDLPLPSVWYPLRYGGFSDHILTIESMPCPR